jgi:hypothetical protein
VNGNRDAGVRDIDHGIDLAVVEPLPRDLGADVGLHLVVGADDLDRLAENRRPEFFDRHARRFDRAGSAVVTAPTRKIGQDTDPDRIVRNLRRRR